MVYSSRGQSEDHVASVKKHGWRTTISFGQRADPCIGLFAKFMSIFIPAQHNNNVSFIPNLPGLPDAAPVGHRKDLSNLYLVTDNTVFQKVDPETLEPLGFAKQTKLHPELKGATSCAHAQRDPETGDMFNFNLDFAGRNATYRFFKVDAATGKTDILATVSDRELAPAYIHSLFLTENYVILCVPVAHFGWGGLKILWERNLIDAIKPFDASQRCKWIVVDRRHGKGEIARFSTPAAFFFHSVNAFEESTKDETGANVTKISLDHVRYDDSDIMFSLYYDILKDEDDAYKKRMLPGQRYKKSMLRLTRYEFTLPTADRKAKSFANEAREVFAIPNPHAGDLPTINPRFAGRPYRFAYGICNKGRSVLLDSIVKTDVQTRDALIWSGPLGHSPGEPIFVPRPGGTHEDDGVLMSVVLDGSTRTSYLLCLDAETLDEVGRAETDFPIALGLHGFHSPLDTSSRL